MSPKSDPSPACRLSWLCFVPEYTLNEISNAPQARFSCLFFWLLLTFVGTLILSVFYANLAYIFNKSIVFGLFCFVLFFSGIANTGVVVSFRNTASFNRMNFWFTFFLPGGLDDSLILANDASKISQLNTWLLPHLQSPDRSYWQLCYRASNHGWSSETFHRNCDNKGPTVTIVRVGIYIFGGYSDKSWKCKCVK